MKMGLFDKLLVNFFRKDKNGDEAFYPHGLLGEGYVLPNEETKIKVKSFYKKYSAFSFIFLYVILITAGLKVALFLIIPLFGIDCYVFHVYTKKLKIYKSKPTVLERIKTHTLSLSLFMLLLCFLGSLMLIFLIINNTSFEPGKNFIDLVITVFLCGGAILFGWMIYYNLAIKVEKSE
jgi:hypothetical protein